MKRTYKKRRTPSRRKNVRRKRTSTRLATKAYVQKAITRKQESKCVSYTDAFYWNSEDATYQRQLMYRYCTPGTTDRGRIGDTIYATKVVIRYKLVGDHFAEDPEKVDFIVPQAIPTLHMKMFLVERKKNNGDVAFLEQWFKSKDRGEQAPYEPISFSNIQNGLNALNTDAYTILAYKSVPLTLTRDKRTEIITGQFSHRFVKPKKIKLTANNIASNASDEVYPNIWWIAYPYWGTDSAWGGNWGLQYSIQQYYKD